MALNPSSASAELDTANACSLGSHRCSSSLALAKPDFTRTPGVSWQFLASSSMAKCTLLGHVGIETHTNFVSIVLIKNRLCGRTFLCVINCCCENVPPDVLSTIEVWNLKQGTVRLCHTHLHTAATGKQLTAHPLGMVMETLSHSWMSSRHEHKT